LAAVLLEERTSLLLGVRPVNRPPTGRLLRTRPVDGRAGTGLGTRPIGGQWATVLHGTLDERASMLLGTRLAGGLLRTRPLVQGAGMVLGARPINRGSVGERLGMSLTGGRLAIALLGTGPVDGRSTRRLRTRLIEGPLPGGLLNIRPLDRRAGRRLGTRPITR
jgi:hypothetical protein